MRKRILIEVLHGLGDTVCAIPMIKKIRDTFPEAYILVLTKFCGAKEILEASRIPIDNIITLDIYSEPIRALYTCKCLRNMKFDYGISSCMTPVTKANLFMKIIEPRNIIGLQYNQGISFDQLEDKYHFVEANLQAVKDLVLETNKKIYPKLIPDVSIIKQITIPMNQLRSNCKVIGICIGDADYSLKNRWLRTGKVYTRSWGIKNMVGLIKLILEEENFSILLIGGKAEERLLPTLNRAGVLNHPRVVNYVGKTSIRESISLISQCDLVFGVDTGMQHVAAALGVPTVSVFGPTNPKTHGAYAENASFIVNPEVCEYQYCYGTKWYVDCPNKRICLKSITAGQVFHAIKRELQ